MAPAKSLLMPIRYGLVLLVLGLPLLAWGLDSDRDQPILIEADKASLNDKTGFSVYEGKVRLQQGTLIFTGNKMTVQLTNRELDTLILTGSPATYAQRPQGKDKDQHAEANIIEYYAIDERVVLQDKARIWETGADEFRSERIVFNLKDDTVDAGGGGNKGRVHITLQPRNNKEKTAVTSEQQTPAANNDPLETPAADEDVQNP